MPHLREAMAAPVLPGLDVREYLSTLEWKNFEI
jgi:hypothetical protein